MNAQYIVDGIVIGNDNFTAFAYGQHLGSRQIHQSESRSSALLCEKPFGCNLVLAHTESA